MKKRFLALVTSVMVGVMCCTPMMVEAACKYHNCDHETTTSSVIYDRTDYVNTRECNHYPGETDYYAVRTQTLLYYCHDCECTWTGDVEIGWAWICGRDL